MIKASKRLISILICLTLVLAMLPMAVFAAGTTLYCDAPDDWTCCYVYWWGSAETNPGWPGMAMTQDANGIWYYEVPSDADNVIFTNKADGSNGVQSGNLDMPTGENVQYTYEKNAWGAYGAEVEVVAPVLYLRGLTNWGADDSNKMTLNDDGTYSIVIAVAAGTHEYKVADANWAEQCPDSGNLYLNVATACDVTFVYNPASDVVTATGDGVTTTYYVAGDETLTGANWDPAAAANAMTLDENTGVCFMQYNNVAAGNYQLKVTTGSWNTPSWGDETASGNFEVSLAVASNVVVSFNTNTETANVAVLPLTSSAPEAAVLGDNNFEAAVGDRNPVTATYTATESGILVINPTAVNTYSDWTCTWEASHPMMAFGRMAAVVVNGENQYMLPAEIAVEAGDTVEVGIFAGGAAMQVTLNLSIREPGVKDVKWQLSEDGSDLRLVTYADSLDYSEISFNVTISGVTKVVSCETVYEAINAGGLKLENAGETFETYALYYVTYTLTDIPDALRGQDISVSVTWTPLEGEATTSETRVITVPTV